MKPGRRLLSNFLAFVNVGNSVDYVRDKKVFDLPKKDRTVIIKADVCFGIKIIPMFSISAILDISMEIQNGIFQRFRGIFYNLFISIVKLLKCHEVQYNMVKFFNMEQYVLIYTTRKSYLYGFSTAAHNMLVVGRSLKPEALHPSAGVSQRIFCENFSIMFLNNLLTNFKTLIILSFFLIKIQNV